MEINILGKGEGWEQAPKPGEGICWGINDLLLMRPVDLVVEMHDYEWTGEQIYEHQKAHLEGYFTNVQLRRKAARKRYVWDLLTDKINENKIPMLSVKKYDHIPTSIEFPLEKAIEMFNTDYFSCGVSYMMAYAIMQNPTDINFYGCNLATGSEYMWQRMGFEFWCGIACGRGIKVNSCGNDYRPLQTVNQEIYGYLGRPMEVHTRKLQHKSDKVKTHILGHTMTDKQAEAMVRLMKTRPREYAHRKDPNAPV